MSVSSTYYYRVCDCVSNPVNLITEFITRKEHNTIYKSYKQATIIANERLKARLGAAYDATVASIPELLFTEDNKADCETNGYYARVFPVQHLGGECFVGIIPILAYKPAALPLPPKRRSARVAALPPVNYNEGVESESEELLGGGGPVAAPAAPAPVVDLTHEEPEDPFSRSIIQGLSSLSMNSMEDSVPVPPLSVIPKRLGGGAGIPHYECDDDPM